MILQSFLHRNGKGVPIAIYQAWKAGRIQNSIQEISVNHQLREVIRHTLARKPDLWAGLLNGFLQFCFFGGYQCEAIQRYFYNIKSKVF
jgi:hypothetical protein